MASATAQNLTFPGQYRDDETQLSHNWHRTYDPTLGRYLQSDSIGLAGGINRYAYVGGNPVGYVDPSGLSGRGARSRRGGSNSFVSENVQFFYEQLIRQIREAETQRFGSPQASAGCSSCVITGRDLDILRLKLTRIKSGYYDNYQPSAQVTRNRLAGQKGEIFLSGKFGGSQQVYQCTSLGGRFIDNLSGNTAREAKVGRTCCSGPIRRQIQKDIELRSTPNSGINSIEWHFFRSGVTGEIGPTAPLRGVLERSNIDIIVHK
jgi:RHS repeat-associated protein